MSVSEFDIISTFLNRRGLAAGDDARHIQLGIGDDCALISVPQEQQLALSMDILVESYDFPPGSGAHDIAVRAMAVNLSDLAAMGAEPLGFTLGLILTEAEQGWLEEFARGLSAQASKYQCPLIGGDISKGPVLTVIIQMHGLLDAGSALRRDGARPGDLIMVSGELGDAALGLRQIQEPSFTDNLSDEQKVGLREAYFSPQPQLVLGRLLSGRATSCIDVSDGLMADLEHLARSSHVGMTVQFHNVPVSAAADKLLGMNKAREQALTWGDDYQLAFTVPQSEAENIEQSAQSSGVKVTRVGMVTEGTGVTCVDKSGNQLQLQAKGYRHF